MKKTKIDPQPEEAVFFDTPGTKAPVTSDANDYLHHLISDQEKEIDHRHRYVGELEARLAIARSKR